MNRLDNAQKRGMIAVLCGIRGSCMGLAKIHINRIKAACNDEELRIWSNDAKESGKTIIEFGAKLANRSGTGIVEDELATNAARYLGSKGGKIGGTKGGKVRMESLTPEQRSDLGRWAAAARWAKRRAAKQGA